MIELRRVDPSRNMHGFYRLDTQPDLFGGVFLMKQSGRIGARGRITAERFDSLDNAAVAMQRQAEKKPGVAIAKCSNPGYSGHAGDAAGTAESDPYRFFGQLTSCSRQSHNSAPSRSTRSPR
jgi:predicted DNA-binding WGR domain protein